MPYRITRSAESLVWVVMEGHLTLPQAEGYFAEMWDLLDGCPAPTDLLVDGRRIAGAAHGARRRTEQIAHHPHLGHLAFVVGELHLLLFAPLVKLVSGVGLFGDEREALGFLRESRGLPLTLSLELPAAPGAAPSEAPQHHTLAQALEYTPAELLGGHQHPAEHAHRAHPAPTRPLPPRPTSRLKGTPLYMRERPAPAEGRRAGAGDGEE
jgi:hypothetical protein